MLKEAFEIQQSRQTSECHNRVQSPVRDDTEEEEVQMEVQVFEEDAEIQDESEPVPEDIKSIQDTLENENSHH